MDHAGLDERADHEKEPAEEREHAPLDAIEGLLDRPAGPGEEGRGAEQGDDRGLEPEGPLDQEEQDHGPDHHDRFPEQDRVDDRGFRVESGERRRDPLPLVRGGRPVSAEEEVEEQDKHAHIDHRDGRHHPEKVPEREPGGRADHDVRRIADQGRGPADVRGEDDGEQVRQRVHLEVVREVQEHGRHEQDRGHVVEEGRDDRREDREEDEEAERMVPGSPGRADREPVEEARVAGERDDHHHPGKEQERVEVEVDGDPVPGDEPGSDRDHPARDRCDRTMDPLVHDQRVYPEKEREGGERGSVHGLCRDRSARGRLRLVPHVQELRRRDLPHGPHPGPPRPPGRRGCRASRAAARDRP